MLTRQLTFFIAALVLSATVTIAFLLAKASDEFRATASGASLTTTEPGRAVWNELFSGAAVADEPPDEMWALADPHGFLTYVRSQDRIDLLVSGLVSALVVVPEEVLALASEYPALQVSPDCTLEEAAVAAVAEYDVAKALAYFEALPQSDRSRRISYAIAEAWARRNPADAIQWAEGLEPPARGAIAKVIVAIAESDIDAALELYESFEAPAPNHLAVRSDIAGPDDIARGIVGQTTSNSERERIARFLLLRRTERSVLALEELMTHWSRIDVAAATQWVARFADRLPPELPVDLIGEFAARDAAAAASLADQLPVDMRASVAAPIAQRLARRDPIAAARWIEQFGDHPVYTSLYRSVVEDVVREDPSRAAAMLTSSPPVAMLKDPSNRAERRLEGDVAEVWARQDLAGATAWAQNIANESGRASAVRRLAAYWAGIDADAAQQWVRNLPRDEARHDALLTLISDAVLSRIDLKPETLSAFGSEPKNQEELGNLIVSWNMDPIRAIAQAREWISDPEVRRRTVERLEAQTDPYSL